MKIWLAIVLLPSIALAHEGREPLPTTGARVQGDRLMLSASASKAIGMQLGKVELAEVRRTVQAACVVELPWSQQAYVSTLIAGRVERVLVKPGESVTAGQELARISGTELESLQLALLQAATEKSLVSRLLKSQTSVGDAIAGRVLLQTQTDLAQQSAKFNSAWQKLQAIGLSDAALQQICDTRQTVATIPLDCPISGVVSAADSRAGQIVQPAEHLYHIVDPSRVWIVGKVLEADAGQVKAGMRVDASFAMLPKARFESPIDHIELRLNRDRTVSVKALVENPDGVLKPGMFGRLEIELSSARAVVCPAEALIRDGPATDAIVEQSAGAYVRKTVVVAAVRGQQAEIEDGLFPGDKVVTVGSHELAALFARRPKPKAAATAKHRTGIVAHGQIEIPTAQKSFASVPIDGRIRRILVEHGQPVEKGDVLAELESLPFTSLQLDFLQARIHQAQAAISLERAESLRETLARKELWQSQTQHDTYRQSVASLRRRLILAGQSEDEVAELESADLAASRDELSTVLTIRAPAAGLVCDFDLIPGQFVAQKTELFELQNPNKVWLRAFVFELDAIHIKPGQVVQVALASDPAFHATGKVDRLDPVLNGGNRALSVWTELDDPAGQLKEGMAATVTIYTAKQAAK